ncbi:hypothetical protein HK405_015449, partial [Cladochytrium tenue]
RSWLRLRRHAACELCPSRSVCQDWHCLQRPQPRECWRRAAVAHLRVLDRRVRRRGPGRWRLAVVPIQSAAAAAPPACRRRRPCRLRPSRRRDLCSSGPRRPAVVVRWRHCQQRARLPGQGHLSLHCKPGGRKRDLIPKGPGPGHPGQQGQVVVRPLPAAGRHIRVWDCAQQL